MPIRGRGAGREADRNPRSRNRRLVATRVMNTTPAAHNRVHLRQIDRHLMMIEDGLNRPGFAGGSNS